MKELTIKEEALDVVKQMVADGQISQDVAEKYFPELKESEGERIRAFLHHTFTKQYLASDKLGKWHGEPVTNILAWLEKQGEHANFRNNIQIGDKVTRNEDGVLVNLSQLNRVAKPSEKQCKQNPIKCNEEWYDFVRWFVKERTDNYTLIPSDTDIHTWGDAILDHAKKELEKQGEQKPADKVEPKFHEGDWVIYDHRLYQVVELPKEGYINLGLRGNGKVVYAPSTYCRHWTIKDAKDGDVLSYRDGQWCFIYKGIVAEDTFKYYALLSEKGITVNDAAFSLLSSCITPATKEQRDQLEKAMADAGYTFDFDKKELKKIEPKQEWSEEDMYKIENALFGTYAADVATRLLNKIKSLRPQSTWKPSDEQMEVLLSEVTAWTKGCPKQIVLESLYQDLQKLK